MAKHQIKQASDGTEEKRMGGSTPVRISQVPSTPSDEQNVHLCISSGRRDRPEAVGEDSEADRSEARGRLIYANMKDARKHFAFLTERANSGATVVLTRRGLPYAAIVKVAV